MDSIEESIIKMIQNDKAFFSLVYNSVPHYVQQVIEYRYSTNGKVLCTRKEAGKDLLYTPAYQKATEECNTEKATELLHFAKKYENTEYAENRILQVEKKFLSTAVKVKKSKMAIKQSSYKN